MRKILVANRGEIAVRVLRACRDMGLASVAVYSECDRGALHVRMADEACFLGPAPAADSYLRIDRLVEAARLTGADGLHPGYGFLAEHPGLAAACRDAGITFIGPTPEAIARMGSKTAARTLARDAGVPVVPGSDDVLGPDVTDDAALEAAAQVGYPLMLKAVAGGGGKGMRVVSGPEALAGALHVARSEALAAFGDASVYLERRLLRPRHIEVQLLADHHGTVVPFVERECSIQRRHQKVVEESPSPVVSPTLRARLQAAAVAVARAGGYTNAGTIEFLVDEHAGGEAFYFLEMNTRLQVEHPITELVTGTDLVQWQIRIARGERLTIDPARVARGEGHAIECRVYAEDPDAGFVPSPGVVDPFVVPAGPGVRHDAGIEPGGEVPIFYDALIAKLAVWGASRDEAIRRTSRALEEYRVGGVRTTIPFFRWLMVQPAFREGAFDTSFLDELLQQRVGTPFSAPEASLEEVAAIAAALYGAQAMPLRTHETAGPRAPLGAAGRARWKATGRMDGLRA